MSNLMNRIKKLEEKNHAPNEVALWAIKEVREAEKHNRRPLYKEFRPGESMLTQMARAQKLTRDYGSHGEYLKALEHLGETINRMLKEVKKIVEKKNPKT